MTQEDKGAPPAPDPIVEKAQRAKAIADARTAEAAARKAELEADDLESVAGQQAREAKNKQAIAEADQKAALARQQEIAALLPDLSKVKDSTLATGKEGPAIASGSLTFGALAEAGKAIGKAVAPADADPPRRILITSDQDLASADAIHQEVTSGLDELQRAAAKTLEDSSIDGWSLGEGADLAIVPIAAALASALPHVLSLLSAERSLSTASITVTDLAAAAAVAGALAPSDRVAVFHDDFRLIPSGRVQTAVTAVATKRRELVTRKIELTDFKLEADGELTTARTREREAEKAFNEANPKTPELRAELEAARRDVSRLALIAGEVGIRLALVESLVGALDEFMKGVRIVATGARRSPLATSALYDQLQADAPTPFTHVLLIKGQAAQSQQLTDDKPLWFKDKFSTIVEVNVTFMCLETTGSKIVRAGTVTAMATAHGNLGSRLDFQVRTPVAGV